MVASGEEVETLVRRRRTRRFLDRLVAERSRIANNRVLPDLVQAVNRALRPFGCG